MSNPTDPTPHDLPPLPPPPPPADDDVPMALTDLDEIAGEIPAAEPVPEGVAFDLPHLPDVPAGEHTIGMPLADLADSAVGLPPIPSVSPADSWATDDEVAAVRYDPPGGQPPASASSSALFDDGPPRAFIPPAGGGSASDLFGGSVPTALPTSGFSDLPGAIPGGGSASSLFGEPPAAIGESASSLFGEPPPAAEPVSEFDVPVAAAVGDSGLNMGTAPSVGDSGLNVGADPPVDPVAPASGWLSPADEAAPAAEPAPLEDGIEAELAGPLPPVAHGEGSDIFASAPPPTSRLLGDQSDVIAATSWADAEPATPPPVRGGGRPSDVALTFDLPPGGSTIQEPAAADDLPVADEVFEAEPLFGDSATLAHTPALPGADAPDFGGPAGAGPDASSILADLTEPAAPLTDGSVVRLESPGIDPTLSDDQLLPAEFVAGDATEADDDAPAGYANLWGAGGPADPEASPDPADDVDLGAGESGSDLFAGSRPAGSRFELTPEDPGQVDPFAGIDEGDEPSLASAPSSIFTTPAVPLSGLSDLPTGEADAVEFSDHPDPIGGAVEFDLADGPDFPDRTMRSPVPDDDALDLTDPDRPALPNPSTGDVLAAAGREEDSSLDWFPSNRPDPTDLISTPAPPAPAGTPLSRSRLPRSRPVDLSEPTDPGLSEPGFVPEPTAPARGSSTPRPAAGTPGTGSVELDWVSASSSNEVLLPPEPSRAERPGRRTPAPVDYEEEAAGDATGPTRAYAAAAGGGVNRRAGAGLLLGLILGGGIASGVYFSGVVDQPATPKGPGPSAASTTPGNTAPPPAAAAPLTVADARAALDAGDPARALKSLEAAGATTPEAKAARGQARLLARLREATAPAADDAALKDARADLEAVVNDADAAKTADGEKAAVRAAVHLGLTHELAGDRAKARDVYESAAKKFPKAAEVFQAALDRLDATAPPAAPGAASIRLTPADAERLTVAAAFLFVQDEPAPPAAAEPAEAGGLFWRAANLAAAGRYADAAAAIDRAKAAHQARARALAGRGLNPLTDPLEQIFPRTCDDLKAYWELRRTLYDHPGVGTVVRADGVGKALDSFAGYKTDRDTARADAKLAGEKLAVAQKGLLAEQEALKLEKAALKAEKESTTKLTDDLKKEKAEALVLTKDVETAKKQSEDLTTKAKMLESSLASSEKGRKDADATLAGVAAELKAAKLLPEKHGPAEVVAAAKSAASRATGPDLTSLIPPGTAAAVGGAATTGTLVDLAGRATKLDAAAKQSAADLTVATARFKAEAARSKTEYEAAMKTAADAHTTALKKAADDADKVIARAKADSLADVTKAKADAAATVTKLKTEYAAATAGLEKKAAEDAAAARATLAATEKRFRDDMANAVTPAEALPLWVPLLAELRRPADADPALAAAALVLKTAPPASDDAARANTVAGLALALKGDPATARLRFEAAKRSPAYAAGKEWARAADVGLASLTDPAAASRVAVGAERRRNPAEAGRSLDAGIAAYNAGRYEAADRALADAAWHDDTNPLPWYFLGAARWAAGNAEKAREDFAQGAERERRSLVPGRVVSAGITPIQGAVRTALEAARP
ncbi:MAG TPA: hypothetical protein VH092_24110 [Urbifossiella sp.]|nr:hypothetical protein [Urbifossiella sp.]